MADRAIGPASWARRCEVNPRKSTCSSTPSSSNRRPSALRCLSPSCSVVLAGDRAELSLHVPARSIRGPGIARVPFPDLRSQVLPRCSCLEAGNLARVTPRGKVNPDAPVRPTGLVRDDVCKRSRPNSGPSSSLDRYRGVARHALRFRLDLVAAGTIIWYVREKGLDCLPFLTSPPLLLTELTTQDDRAGTVTKVEHKEDRIVRSALSLSEER